MLDNDDKERLKSIVEGRTVENLLIGNDAITLVFTDAVQFNISHRNEKLHFGAWKESENFEL